MHDWCLVTDIDGTLIGETETSVRLREAVLVARARMAEKGARLRWVIATGRDLESCDEVLLDQGFRLEDFDARVTCVGAELVLHGETAYDAGYHQRLSTTGFDARRVRKALADLPFLSPQFEHEQREHKVSYSSPGSPQHQARVKSALKVLGFETLTIFSHDNYLDIAPVNGAKGGAVSYLLERWGIPPERAVAAGDSGNDRSMLEADWHGIVVANGYAELADLRAHPRVYFATKKHAAGILEGLEFHGFL